MQKRKIFYWQIAAILFTWILGTLLHFTYEWYGENTVVGVFSAVNESTWEHLKLSFFPMLLFSLIEGIFLYKSTHNYIEAKAIALFLSILLITSIFYTYTGILGTHFAVIDIFIFIVSVLLAEWIAYKIMIRDEETTVFSKILSMLIILLLLICFLTFTFKTPHVQLFEDPITKEYGIQK